MPEENNGPKCGNQKPGNQVAETAARKTLREAAKAQAQQLGPTGLENLGKVIKKMKQKAPGPDGWTCQFLKDLDEAGVQGLKEQMIEWERQGRLPGQLCVTLVTMLAKNDKIERPIGLTHYAYRAWARTRWPLYETWAREFTQNTPWDKAKKGVSSLDVALPESLDMKPPEQGNSAVLRCCWILRPFMRTFNMKS